MILDIFKTNWTPIKKFMHNMKLSKYKKNTWLFIKVCQVLLSKRCDKDFFEDDMFINIKLVGFQIVMMWIQIM